MNNDLYRYVHAQLTYNMDDSDCELKNLFIASGVPLEMAHKAILARSICQWHNMTIDYVRSIMHSDNVLPINFVFRLPQVDIATSVSLTPAQASIIELQLKYNMASSDEVLERLIVGLGISKDVAKRAIMFRHLFAYGRRAIKPGAIRGLLRTDNVIPFVPINHYQLKAPKNVI